MPKTKEILAWLKKAEDDLAAATALFEKKAPFWVACFHCQQAVEKALKAAQIYFVNDFQEVKNFTNDEAELASDLRAKYSVKLPDAINISCAMLAQAEVFITNDKKLKQVKEIPILVLENYD